MILDRHHYRLIPRLLARLVKNHSSRERTRTGRKKPGATSGCRQAAAIATHNRSTLHLAHGFEQLLSRELALENAKHLGDFGLTPRPAERCRGRLTRLSYGADLDDTSLYVHDLAFR